MIPVFARDIFHLGASGLAWMMGVAGAGAFCRRVVSRIPGRLQTQRLVGARRSVWFRSFPDRFCAGNPPGVVANLSLRRWVHRRYLSGGHQHACSSNW